MEKTLSIDDLNKKIETLERILAEKDALLRFYEEQFKLGKQRQFGSSREHVIAAEQIFLFNEAEVLASPKVPEPSVEEQDSKEEVKPQRKSLVKSKGKRAADLKGLPTNVIEHRLPEQEQVCSCCGTRDVHPNTS